MKCCHTLPTTSIHCYDLILDDLFHSFYHYDCEALNKKIMFLRKEPDESIV